VFATNRCASLAAKGLLASNAAEDRANEALGKLLDYGWHADSSFLQLLHANLFDSYSVTYANAYGRFNVKDRLCGFTFAATGADGSVVPYPEAAALASFATASGLPPSGGVGVVYDDSVGGPKHIDFAVSPSTQSMDRALDGFLCLRSLVTGNDPVTGAALSGDAADRSARVRAGILEVQRTGRLAQPTIILQGRADALLPINDTGRAYYALAQSTSSPAVRYYEVTNAQHLDALIGVHGVDERTVPLQVYFTRSLDLMYRHLTGKGELPASQVVRTLRRGVEGGAVPALTAGDMPPLAPIPDEGDAITFSDRTLHVPR
jgi:hydroxybutyrate-dimer hydrolase